MTGFARRDKNIYIKRPCFFFLIGSPTQQQTDDYCWGDGREVPRSFCNNSETASMETGEQWRQASESNAIEIEVKLQGGEKGNNNKWEYNKMLCRWTGLISRVHRNPALYFLCLCTGETNISTRAQRSLRNESRRYPEKKLLSSYPVVP